MPTKKSKKIVRIVFGVIVLVLLTQNACVQATWASHRIRRGMTVEQVLQVSGQWTWGHAYSERPAPEPGMSIGFGSSTIHLMGKDEAQPLASREELAQVLEQQMSGHSWSMSLTYMGGVRASFAVFFDAQGKVQSVSGTTGPP
jgi:hypothetical protein